MNAVGDFHGYYWPVSTNLSGVVSFRFGSAVTSLPAVNCDDSFLLWWVPNQVACWYHAYLPGNFHINLQKVTGRTEVAFIQFFCEDSEMVASLRQVVVDIPSVGGPYEPALPRLKDVTEQVAAAQSLRDTPAQEARQAPERFDIYTPNDSGVSEERATESDGAMQDSEPALQMFSTYTCHPPEVCSSASVCFCA